MNDIIVHISDLHISDQNNPIGTINKNTYLVTPSENHNKDFIDIFTDKVLELEYNTIYLVITGDITDKAEISEFKEAEHVISNISSKLKIKKENILLIPGDHDIHRFSIEQEIRTSKNSTNTTLNKIKFNNFNTLYRNIKGDDFQSEIYLFDYIVLDEFILVALNSNEKVGLNVREGYVKTNEFELEIQSLKEQHPNHELIICTHHNLQGEYEDTTFGKWEIENRKNLIPILERKKINLVFSGNEHTQNSKLLPGTQTIISDSGAFSVKDEVKIKPSFKIYTIFKDESKLYLKNSIYELRINSGTSGNAFGDWITIQPKELKNKEKEDFTLKEYPKPLNTFFDLPADENEESILTNVIAQEETISILQYENKEVQMNLYNIIKEKKLFHQGHFHWSDTSRAHNWIDTARLLEDREDLYFVKNSIIDVLEKMNLIENTNLIIGLGYEGNIISSKVSIKYDIPYTFLPYSYRWEDSHEFENKLNFNNDEKKYKKVILITDVVNDGKTIRKLVGDESREKRFFDNVDEIVVVSLFYTGDKELNHDILNYNKLADKDKKGDFEVNKIQFYTIKQLVVEKCPYGENYKEECFILKDNLHCVHKFYSEDKLV